MSTRRTVLKFLAFVAGASFAKREARALTSSDATEQPLHDPLRPGYHYLPARNWMNDPCGPIYFNGQYHMFHQYNPHGALWGDMHWAHAVSPDMVHWTRLPIALAPTPGSADAEGCFTGSAVVQDGGRLFFTQVSARLRSLRPRSSMSTISSASRSAWPWPPMTVSTPGRSSRPP